MVTYSIYSWNVNGIRATVKNGLIDWIKSTNAEIICFQEVKAEMEQLPKQLTELKYDIALHTAERKGYSGVMTMSQIQPVEVSTTIGQSEFDSEGRVVMTRYPEFILFNVYFPNGKKNAERLDYKMRFYQQFLDICREMLKKGEHIVVCGDVNTAHKEQDLANPKPNAKYSGFLPKERAWIDDFLNIGFVDSYRLIHGDGEGDFTWWTQRVKSARENNVGWRIDYFYVSDNLKSHLKDASIHKEVQGSDHCPISITLEF